MELYEIKNKLENGVIHKNGEIDDPTGDAIINYAKNLAKKITGLSEKNADNSRKISEIAKSLLLTSWCYPIETKLIPETKVDRLSSMFCGPFFISEEHPWPTIDGKFYEPLIQFDLSIIKPFSPINPGDGLFQIWVNGFLPDEYFIRIIPKENCKIDNISPVPQDIDKYYFDEIERTGDSYLAWPAIHYKKKEPHVFIFSGLSKRIFWRGGMQDLFCDAEHIINDKKIIASLKEFVEIFPYDNPSTEPHFFGTFSPIQYDPIDCDPTFVALEGGPCFNWNYGNAQVSYRVEENGKVTFGFECSCQ